MQWDFEHQTTDMLLEFLRLDKDKMNLQKVSVTFNNQGLQVVELIYIDKQTNKPNRCLIGINGLGKADQIGITPR